MKMKYTVKFEKPHVGEKTTGPALAERTARLLATAYHVDKLMADGVYRDYTTAAVTLRISPSRLSQIMGLLLLSARIQEDILMGKLLISEKRLRSISKHVVWEMQREKLHHR